MPRVSSLLSALIFCGAVFLPQTSWAQNAYRSILGGEIRSKFEPAREVNVRHDGAVSRVRLGDTRALRLILDYTWPGGDLDWNRHGQPGFAQRIQFRENGGSRMRAGRDYWYTASFFLPSSVPRVRSHTLSVMDFKHHIGTNGSVPTVSFNFLKNGSFNIIESLSSEWNCGTYRNINGGRTAVCDFVESVGRLGSQAQFSGRWVQIVAHMRWADNPSGFYRLWIDQEPIFAFEGNTLQGTTEVAFKFGPYRHHITRDPGRMEIFYSNVARARTCERLGVVDCTPLQAALPRIGFQNIVGRERWVSNSFSDSQ